MAHETPDTWQTRHDAGPRICHSSTVGFLETSTHEPLAAIFAFFSKETELGEDQENIIKGAMPRWSIL